MSLDFSGSQFPSLVNRGTYTSLEGEVGLRISEVLHLLALGCSGVLSRARQGGGPFAAGMRGITLMVYQLASGSWLSYRYEYHYYHPGCCYSDSLSVIP